jgi:hypothetical protein
MERATPCPCLALLPVGVTRPRTLLPRRWSLTPPFHPYGSHKCEFRGMFLWPNPEDRSPPDVIRHRALWSADFPQSHLVGLRSPDRPGLTRCYHKLMRKVIKYRLEYMDFYYMVRIWYPLKVWLFSGNFPECLAI